MMKKCNWVLVSSVLAGTLALSFSPAFALSPDAETKAYTASLSALNSSVTGSATSGEARFEVVGDNLVITVNVTGAPAGITHWQHFHGFESGVAASCATQAADANGDGILDLIETEQASGTTMVPFTQAPAAMDVAHGTYPEADADGNYSYKQVVPLEQLQSAFAKAFDGKELKLGHRVVYIHGIPENSELPSSVASLGPIPAHVTLPIACGDIVPAQ